MKVPIVVDSSGLQTVTTNLEYDVSVDTAEVAIRDLEFSVAGEVHTSLWERMSSALIPSAWAHPGHYEGGDLTGELLGSFSLQFGGDEAQELGTATLLIGNYRSVNFFFERGEAGELKDHTAIMRGVARREDTNVEFRIVLDSPENRRLVGAPFEQRIEEGTEVVAGLRLLVQDPVEGDTLFDDVDFIALDDDADGELVLGPDSPDTASVDAYNLIHRKFQSHDHFDMRVQD